MDRGIYIWECVRGIDRNHAATARADNTTTLSILLLILSTATTIERFEKLTSTIHTHTVEMDICEPTTGCFAEVENNAHEDDTLQNKE